MTEVQARHFADDWLRAWNEHDADAILDHYSPDVVYTSAFVSRLSPCHDDTLVGRDAVAAYVREGLKQFPDLHFVPDTVYVGPNSLVLTYTSVENRRAAEFLELDGNGKIRRALAHYQGLPNPVRRN